MGQFSDKCPFKKKSNVFFLQVLHGFTKTMHKCKEGANLVRLSKSSREYVLASASSNGVRI